MNEMSTFITAAVASVVAGMVVYLAAYRAGKREGIRLAGDYMAKRFQEMKEELIAEREKEENN